MDYAPVSMKIPADPFEWVWSFRIIPNWDEETRFLDYVEQSLNEQVLIKRSDFGRSNFLSALEISKDLKGNLDGKFHHELKE